MKPVIALPFEELTVQVMEEPDPTCLLRIRGRKHTVVGRKSIYRNTVKIHTEEGWKDGCPRVIPVVEVVSRE